MDSWHFGLENGSKYEGEQKTHTGPFKIDMKVDVFDLSQFFMCGTFKIFNLTKQHDIIHTYFECEIVDSEKRFRETGEMTHWATFNEWKDDFMERYDPLGASLLFMRIKELFLLPDPSVKHIPGASIDGYYYCIYNKQSDSFKGFYYYESCRAQPTQKIVLSRSHPLHSMSANFR